MTLLDIPMMTQLQLPGTCGRSCSAPCVTRSPAASPSPPVPQATSSARRGWGG